MTDSGLPIKALSNLTVDEELQLKGCFEKNEVTEPAFRDALVAYVRDALELKPGDDASWKAYNACYINVVNCGEHPCKTPPRKRPAVTTPADSELKSSCRPPKAQELLRQGRDQEGEYPEVALGLLQQALDLSSPKCGEAAGRLGILERRLRRPALDAHHHLKTALDDNSNPWVAQYRSRLQEELRATESELGSAKEEEAPAPPTPAPLPARPKPTPPPARGTAAPSGVKDPPPNPDARRVAIQDESPATAQQIRKAEFGAVQNARQSAAPKVGERKEPVGESKPPPVPEPRLPEVEATARATPASQESQLKPEPPPVSLHPERPPAPPSPVVAAPPQLSQKSSLFSDPRDRVCVALGVVALAVLGAGVIEQVRWQLRVRSFNDRTDCDGAFDQHGGPGCQQLYSEGQTAKTFMFVGYGTAGALAAVSAILFWTGSSHDEQRPLACATSAFSFRCGLHF